MRYQCFSRCARQWVIERMAIFSCNTFSLRSVLLLMTPQAEWPWAVADPLSFLSVYSPIEGHNSTSFNHRIVSWLSWYLCMALCVCVCVCVCVYTFSFIVTKKLVYFFFKLLVLIKKKHILTATCECQRIKTKKQHKRNQKWSILHLGKANFLA